MRKQQQQQQQQKLYNNTIIVGTLTPPHSITKKTIQMENQRTSPLNNILNQMDSRIFYSKITEYTFFSEVDMDHSPGDIIYWAIKQVE